MAIFAHPWVYYSLVALYAATVVVILGIILSENRNPVKSLAWVTVLLLVPGLGIILYIFFGRSIKNTRMISRRYRRRLKRAERYRPVDITRQGLNPLSTQNIQLGRSLCSAPFYPDNDITVFTNGQSKFAALEKDLQEAREYINIQYYIFEDDSIGDRIANILKQKAREGLAVRVIYDHVGSFHTSRKFFKELKQAGVEAYPFFRVVFPPFGTRINWRNHRKLCVIDGKIGYIGGMNIADRYIDGGKRFKSWRDTHLRVTGPAVRSLLFSFAVDWSFMGKPLIDTPRVGWNQEEDRPGTVGAQLITSGPTSQWSNVAYMFHKAIAGAQKRIYLQTPYFLPTDGLLHALQTAALAHVDVRIMLPVRSDSDLLRYASFSYISECLRSGIKIYLYKPGMLHSKVIIVDDDLVSVGSTNFDFRSFEHNFEANLFLYSRTFNRRMTDIFMSDLRECQRILPSNWKHRPLYHRAAESVLRLLAPIL